jgi:hypothetical protein
MGFVGSHDITHCNRETCPSKDTCRRYQAHLDAVEKKLDWLTYLVNDELSGLKDGKCQIYWEM